MCNTCGCKKAESFECETCGCKDAESFENETFCADCGTRRRHDAESFEAPGSVAEDYSEVLHDLDDLEKNVKSIVAPKRRPTKYLRDAKSSVVDSWRQVRKDGFGRELYQPMGMDAEIFHEEHNHPEIEMHEAEYSVDKLSKMSFKEIDRKSGFLGDRLANLGVIDSWTKLSNSKRKEILNKIKKQESWLGWEAESFEAQTSTKEMNKAYKQYKINLEKYVGFGDLWEKIHDESLRLQSQGLIAFDAWNKACKKFKVYDKLTKGVNMEHLREREKRYEPDSYYGGAESLEAEWYDREFNLIGRRSPRKMTLKVSDLKKALENANNDADVFVGDVTPVGKEMLGEPIVSSPRGVWTNGEDVYIVGATDWIDTEQISELTYSRVDRAKNAESFEASQNLKCDLCGLSQHKKIKNQWGQTFYYCTNDKPNEYSDGCVGEDRAEGKWLMDDGMHYLGEVVGINNPENAYLVNNCPQCGVSFVVSDSSSIDYCDGCVRDSDAESFDAKEYNYYFKRKAYLKFRKNFEKIIYETNYPQTHDKFYKKFIDYINDGLSEFDAGNKAMKEMGIYDDIYQGVDMNALKAYEGIHTSNAESFQAESNFDKLANKIAAQYRAKGKSPAEAMRIGKATAAKIGFRKYGKAGMRRKAMAGRAKSAENYMKPQRIKVNKKSSIINYKSVGILSVAGILSYLHFRK